MPCTTCPTSLKLSPSNGSPPSSDRGACCASTTSPSPSMRERPSTSLKPGSQTRQNNLRRVGLVPNSRKMSARNTSPLAGFLSRCLSGRASRFGIGATTLLDATQHTPASRLGNAGGPGRGRGSIRADLGVVFRRSCYCIGYITNRSLTVWQMSYLQRLLAPRCVAFLGPDPSPERQERP